MAELTMYRGNDKSWTLTIVNAAGAAQNLTDCTVWWTLTRQLPGRDAVSVIEHYWTEDAELGLSRIHPVTAVEASLAFGILYHSITHLESIDLAYNLYHYEVKVEDAAGKLLNTEDGTLIVNAAVMDLVAIP